MVLKRGFLMLAAVAMVAACGVKSEPDRPDPNAFPLTYPVDRSASSGVDAPARRAPLPPPTSRTTSGGVYAPPPPATQFPR